MRPRRPVSLMKKRVLLEVTSPNSSGPGGVRPSSPRAHLHSGSGFSRRESELTREHPLASPPPQKASPPPPASGFGLLPRLEVRAP